MELYFHLEDKQVLVGLSNGIHSFYSNLYGEEDRPILIICIGTDRSTGDCLGPLTGTFLTEMPGKRFQVMGSLDEPVHATNLARIKKSLQETSPLPFIVAVDAGLGKKQNVGKVTIKKGPLYPGSGVNKDLPPVGDMHLTGLVNVGGYMEYFVLQSTRLNLVFKMSRLLAKALYQSTNRFLHEVQPLSCSRMV
ncbi:MAG: spore protease YyaC [Halanaerobium sp.]|nr:spore protease YyaC [Halanaerobium sp.]